MRALRTAITVCALFSMIVRLADSLGWDLPSPERLRGRAPAMLEGGYALEAVSGALTVPSANSPVARAFPESALSSTSAQAW